MPTNFPSGVTNNTASYILGQLPILDPTSSHTYVNDFDNYVAGDWTLTQTSPGTVLLSDADGGVLTIATAANEDDISTLQLSKETFSFKPGKPLFFKARVKYNVDSLDSVFGLQVRNTDPTSLQAGIYFKIYQGIISIWVCDGNNYVTKDAGNVSPDTFTTIAFYYDGKDKIFYGSSLNESIVTYGSIPITTAPAGQLLTLTFCVDSLDAVICSVSVDYAFVSKQR